MLIEHADSRDKGLAGALNHLGIEVEGPDQVAQATARLSGEGLHTLEQQETTCCFAVQDKVWVEDPDATPWEVYTVLADAPVESGLAGDGACCAGVEADTPAGTVSSAHCC